MELGELKMYGNNPRRYSEAVRYVRDGELLPQIFILSTGNIAGFLFVLGVVYWIQNRILEQV